MTRIQRGWAVAAVLAGALFACTIALFLGGTMPLAPAAALALIAAEVVIDRAGLPKVQRRMPLKVAAGANRSH